MPEVGEPAGEPANPLSPHGSDQGSMPEPGGPPIAAEPGALPPPPGLDSGLPDDVPVMQRSMTFQEAVVERASSHGFISRESAVEKYTEQRVTRRLDVLEMASLKEWWYEGQTALGFTTLIWLVFIYILYTRAGVVESYDSGLSVQQHMENIIAHPRLSGIRVRPVEEDPLPCKCACQSSSAGMPNGPCDPSASETLDFLGRVPAGSNRLTQLSVPALLASNIDPANLGDKLDRGNDDIPIMTWDRIAEPDDVWVWIEHGFIPDVWRQRSQSGGNSTLQGLVAQKNLIIGGVRIRQDRAEWSPTCQDKVSPELAAMYRTDCRSSEPFTESFGPFLSGAAVTSSNSSVSAASSNNTSPTSSDRQSAFQPSTNTEDKGYYDALFDTELDISYALETAVYCRKHNWVDGATHSVTLQTVTLNAEIGMFAIVDIEFKLPAAGGVQKKVKVHTIHATGSNIAFIDIVPELIWAGLIVLLIRQEVVQMLYAGKERKCLDYWLDLWCVVDWFSIFCAILIAIFWLWQITSIGSISEEVAALPRAPFASGPPSLATYRTQWQKILDAAIGVYDRKQYYQLSLFWYNLILAMRFLKNFMAQAKLAMLQLTVGTTSWDLYHLFVFFAMLFLNFQIGGHILFGPEIEAWSTLPAAGATSMRMMLGTYPFAPMYEMAPFSAICWFWSFLFTVVFILLNLIFAMIADYFHVIRGMVGHTDPLWKTIGHSCSDFWWRLGWRKINLEDGEYKVAFLENPYADVVTGLMEASQVPASLERDAHHTCLGVRLGRRHLEAMSIEGLTENDTPGYAEATSKGIQELGPDIMAADHLLEQTEELADEEYNEKHLSMLNVMRGFVLMLRKHHQDMDEHCAGLEAEVTQDHSALVRTVDYLENNVRKCLEEFERLKTEGVHSLAPPMHALPRPGTLAALEAQKDTLVAPGALLRAVDKHMAIMDSKTSPPAEKPPMLGDDVGNNMTVAMLMNSPACAAVATVLSNIPEYNETATLALSNAPSAFLGNAASNMVTSGNIPPEPPVSMLSDKPPPQMLGNAAVGDGATMLDIDDLLRNAAIADQEEGAGDGNAPAAIMDK